MVTRSGSNRFSGSVYDSWRNQAGTTDEDVLTRNKKRGWLWRLNTPYWFNKRDLPKTPAGDYFINDVRLEMPGFRVGGPMVRDKAFYFFNWEWFLWPNQISRTRYLVNTAAQSGVFTYPATDGSGNRTINLLALAASKGQVSTVDPTVNKLLADIRSAAAGWTAGGLSTWDLNTDRFAYSPGGDQYRHFPTVRFDVNLSQNHRLTFSSRYNRFESEPDILNSVEPRFPGFANSAGQYSHRYMYQGTVRSTFGANIVNEARVGMSGGTTQFFPEVSTSQFDCSDPGCQGGYNLLIGATGFNIGTNLLTSATASAAPSSRYVPDIVYEDTLTWLKGAHTLSMGGSLTTIKFENWDNPGQIVPQITFGTNTLDPAYSMFAPASGNFPGGINDTYAGYARNLYALLTGRVTTLTGTAVLDTENQYQYLGDRWQQGRMNELGVFLSDSWRLRPSLTLNYGVRWELQFPFQPDLSSWARPEQWTDVYGVSGLDGMFKPGTLAGRSPIFAQYLKGDHAYDMDWNNFAPSVGMAWRPHIGSGWLSKILSSDPVFRGGYSQAYTRYGTGDFTGIYGANPGSTRAATRSITLGNLGNDYLPVLLRETSRLNPPAMPAPPSYPSSPAINENVATYDPKTTVPFAHQYSFGWQREFGSATAVEVRYVGNRFSGGHTTVNLNRTNDRFVIENGFIEEFKKAQRNLQANIAAGLGNTFAYTGAAGTSPLPIFMAHFAGIPLNDARNQSPANYTSANFRSSAWYNSLAMYYPRVDTITGTGTSGLQSTTFTANMRAAGLPANFWVANPDINQASANLRYNGGTTHYDALQIDLRRRLNKGLLLQGSYVWGKAYTWDRPTMRNDFVDILATNGVDHAIKLNWVYQLPFGQGRKFGSGVSGWVNQLIGGWEFDGAGRVQSGRILDFGNYRLVGMTEKDLQEMFKIYKVKDSAGKERIYMLPQDVIQQSIIALHNTSATSPTGFSGTAPTGQYIARPSSPECVQGYEGQCSPLHLFVTGPWVTRFDFAFVKRFPIGRTFIEARMDLYNVFDAINFNPVTGLGTSLSGWEVTSAFTDTNASQDAGGRITSFGLRFTW
jgi:hypothetical protein